MQTSAFHLYFFFWHAQISELFGHSRTTFLVNKPFIHFVKPYSAMYFRYQSICVHSSALFSPLSTQAVGTQTADCWILLAGILTPSDLICSPLTPFLLLAAAAAANTSSAFRGLGFPVTPGRLWAFPGADNLFSVLLLLLLLILADATALQVARILPLRPSLLLCLWPRWKQGVMDIREAWTSPRCLAAWSAKKDRDAALSSSPLAVPASSSLLLAPSFPSTNSSSLSASTQYATSQHQLPKVKNTNPSPFPPAFSSPDSCILTPASHWIWYLPN